MVEGEKKDEDSKKVEDGTKIKPSKLGVSQSLVNNTREYKVMDAVPSAGHLTGAKSQLGTEVIELLDEYCASIKRTKVLRSHVCHFFSIFFIPRLPIVVLIDGRPFHSFKM